MKRVFCILSLCALLLSGCGGSSVPAPESPTVSLQATAVMGRTYVPEGKLPQEVLPMEQGATLVDQGHIWKAAESPDGRAALYRLNEDTVLVEWDGDVVMFDGWVFATPRANAPWLAVLDVKGMGEADTLIIDLYRGSGTGVSIEELHLLTRDDLGSITDHPLPEALYSEELEKHITVNPKASTLTLGPVTLALEQNKEHPLTGEVVLGNAVDYTIGLNGNLQIELEIEACLEDVLPTLNYVGRLQADVIFHEDTDTYTLECITLGGY